MREIRHLDNNHLCMQKIAFRRHIQFGEVHKLENPIGSMTNEFSFRDIDKYVKLISAIFQNDRAKIVTELF